MDKHPFLSNYQLIELNSLLPHEEVNLIKSQHIADTIEKNASYFFKPIIITKDESMIIDGHHRFTALKNLGLKYAPCILCDYHSDQIIVRENLESKKIINKDQIIHAAKNGLLGAEKSTFHLIKNKSIGEGVHLSSLLERVKVDLIDLK